MNACELLTPAGKGSGVWVCGACRAIWKNSPLAEQCCRPKICSVEGCDDVVAEYRTVCEQHLTEAEARRMQDRWDKAQDAPFWPHEVIWDDGQERYFGSLNEWSEDVANRVAYGAAGDTARDIVEAAYVYRCTDRPLHIDAADVAEHALDRANEDVNSDISDDSITELQRLLDGWCASTGITTFEEDHGHRVPRETLLGLFTEAELDGKDEDA